MMRLGRVESRRGESLGTAEQLLTESEGCFELAATLSPTDRQAHGNWGNALLAHGMLKKRELDLLQSLEGGSGDGDVAAVEMSEKQLLAEAQQLLILAGRKFRRVLELDPSDARALHHWGKALCLRGDLEMSTEAAERLYEAACQKFEAALERQPAMIPAVRGLGLAMRSWGFCKSAEDPEGLALLQDAASCLEEVVRSQPSDVDAQEALTDCQEELKRMGGMGQTFQ